MNRTESARRNMLAAAAILAMFMCAFTGMVLTDDNDVDALSGSSINGTVGQSLDVLIAQRNANSSTVANNYVCISENLPDGLKVEFKYNSGVGTAYRLEIHVTGTPTENSSGTYSITVKPSNSSTTEIEYTGSINITGGDVKVTSITISGPTSAEVGDTLTYTASVSPSNATNKAVTWTISSGSSYATITSQSDTSCTVKANAAGTITIKATADDGSGKTATKSTTISQAETPITSLSISTSGSGSSMTLSATYSPSNATPSFTWEVTKGDVRLSSSSGKSVTAYPEGTGSVTIKLTDSVSGRSATKTIYTYELEYDANGGSGAPSVQRAIGTTNNASMSVSYTEPYKSGMEFMGWATSASGTPRYEGGDTVSVNYNGEVLYAIYGDYGYLEFDRNGGSGSVPSDQSVLIAEDDYEYITIPSSPTPTMSGMEFKEWNTSKSGTGTGYDPGNRVRVDCGETITLYAIYEDPYVTYTLTYNANGGSNAPLAQSVDSKTGTATFTLRTGEPSYSGHIFKGWATNSSGTGTIYQPGATYTTSSTSTTLYAVWEAAVINITSPMPSDLTLIVGEKFSYTVTADVSGCTVSVTGATWLGVSGMTVSGTPTTAGSYPITITVSKGGYTSDSMEFTLTVSSSLTFTSAPSTGVIAYAV